VHTVPTIHSTSSSIDDHKDFPLLTACQLGNIAEVECILKTTTVTEVNQSAPKTGDTPLHLATRYNHTEIVRLLLEHGTMRQVRNSKNKTPVQEAQSADMKVLFNRSTPRFVTLDNQQTLEWMTKSLRAFKMFFAHSSQGINISTNVVRLCFNVMANAPEVANANDKFAFWHLLQEGHRTNNAIYFLKAYTVESSFYRTVNQSLAHHPINDLITVDDDDSIQSLLNLAMRVANNTLQLIENIRDGRPP
jgi:ankyrin repeat protein